MQIVVLDPIGAHQGIECPMRLTQHPEGYWYCIDCGIAICKKSITIDTLSYPNALEEWRRKNRDARPSWHW